MFFLVPYRKGSTGLFHDSSVSRKASFTTSTTICHPVYRHLFYQVPHWEVQSYTYQVFTKGGSVALVGAIWQLQASSRILLRQSYCSTTPCSAQCHGLLFITVGVGGRTPKQVLHTNSFLRDYFPGNLHYLSSFSSHFLTLMTALASSCLVVILAPGTLVFSGNTLLFSTTLGPWNRNLEGQGHIICV